jgi:hypothetical protein
MTPLHVAVREGDLGIAQLLVDAGAAKDPKVIFNRQYCGLTAFAIALGRYGLPPREEDYTSMEADYHRVRFLDPEPSDPPLLPKLKALVESIRNASPHMFDPRASLFAGIRRLTERR